MALLSNVIQISITAILQKREKSRRFIANTKEFAYRFLSNYSNIFFPPFSVPWPNVELVIVKYIWLTFAWINNTSFA